MNGIIHVAEGIRMRCRKVDDFRFLRQRASEIPDDIVDQGTRMIPISVGRHRSPNRGQGPVGVQSAYLLIGIDGGMGDSPINLWGKYYRFRKAKPLGTEWKNSGTWNCLAVGRQVG